MAKKKIQAQFKIRGRRKSRGMQRTIPGTGLSLSPFQRRGHAAQRRYWTFCFAIKIQNFGTNVCNPENPRYTRITDLRSRPMMQINELKQRKDIIHSIDWQMTPEEA